MIEVYERAFRSVPPCSSYIKNIYDLLVLGLSSKSLPTFITMLLLIANIAAVSVHPSSLSIELDGGIYAPGTSVEIVGTGSPNSTLNVTVNSTEEIILNRTIQIDDGGLFNISFKIDFNATLGRYTVKVSSESSEQSLDFKVMNSDCILLKKLIDLMEKTKEKAERTLKEIVNNRSKKDLLDIMEEAEEAELEARQLGEEGDCSEAASKAIDALNLYGRAYNFSGSSSDEDTWKIAEEAIKLGESIERALEYLKRLNQTAADKDDLNHIKVRTKLSDANELLLGAEDLLDGEKLSEEIIQQAEDLRSNAKEILEEVNKLIKNGNKERKKEKTAEFLRKTENRLASLKKSVIEILVQNNATPQSMEAIELAFEQLESNLLDAKEILEQDQVNTAIDKLDETIEDTHDAIKSLDEIKEGLSNKIEATTLLKDKIDELQSRLNSTREEILNYSSNDIDKVNTTNIKMLIDSASERLDEATLLLENKEEKDINIEKADELINEADKIIDEIEELIEGTEEDIEKNMEEDDEAKDNDSEEEPEIDNKDDKYKDKDKDKNKDKEKEDEKEEEEEDKDEDEKGKPEGIPSRDSEKGEG